MLGKKMKTSLKYKNILRMLCLITSIGLSGKASANLINSDFSDGLNGWSGEYSDYNVNDDSIGFYQSVTDFAAFTGNFSTDSTNNSVTLSTSFSDPIEHFGIYLFQEFEVAANSSVISLAFEALADIATIELVDEYGNTLHNFIESGQSFDISTLVGSIVGLEISVEDDYDVGYAVDNNSLTVSNISISSIPVPEPSAFLLLPFALLLLRRKSAIQ